MQPILIMSMFLFLLTGYTAYSHNAELANREQTQDAVIAQTIVLYRAAAIDYLNDNPGLSDLVVPAVDIEPYLPSGVEMGGTLIQNALPTVYIDNARQLYVYISTPLRAGVARFLRTHMISSELIGRANLGQMVSLSSNGDNTAAPILPLPPIIPDGALVFVGR